MNSRSELIKKYNTVVDNFVLYYNTYIGRYRQILNNKNLKIETPVIVTHKDKVYITFKDTVWSGIFYTWVDKVKGKYAIFNIKRFFKQNIYYYELSFNK